MTDSSDNITAGSRMQDLARERDKRNELPGLWTTLDYQLLDYGPGRASISWQATPEYGFPTQGGYVVQGGMVTALLDAAMGNACWTVLDHDQVFLTADLRVEFLRPSRPGHLVAHGSVVRRTRRITFCAAELRDESGTLLATSRCTQAILPATEGAGRTLGGDGSELHEARG